MKIEHTTLSINKVRRQLSEVVLRIYSES